MQKKFFLIFNFLIFNFFNINSRSIYRPNDTSSPYITANWQNSASYNAYTLRDSHLKSKPIFETFNLKYFNKNLLPKDKFLNFRQDPDKKVSGQVLSDLIEKFLARLIQLKSSPRHKRKYKFDDFIILKKMEFNFKTFSGIIIAKFKKYPFIVKLLIENPCSFTNPYTRGVFPMGIFTLSGTSRHIIGLSRIRNREFIFKKIKKSKRWKDKLTLPKKWFWLPKNEFWLEVKGYNFDQKRNLSARIPAIFAVIAEEIISDPNQKPSGQECLKISAYLNSKVDPNYSNFRIEKDTNKLAIIDTEDFKILIGANNKKIKPFKSYKSFFSRCIGCFVHEKLIRTKKSRATHRKIN